MGPSHTLGSLGPSHQWRHKSWVTLRGSPCAHGVSGTLIERCAIAKQFMLPNFLRKNLHILEDGVSRVQVDILNT